MSAFKLFGGSRREPHAVLPKCPNFDFHCHLLPGIDDGSRDEACSIEMLSEMKRQGVSAVVATPHYNAEKEYPDAFIKRRTSAAYALWNAMQDAGEELPQVYLGAEVGYFSGIGRSVEMKKLCIEGTNFILVEMPFCDWDSYIVSDIISLRDVLGLRPILAHIERYIGYARKNDFDELLSSGIRFQSNAEFFIDKKTRKKALDMFGNSMISLVGSDAHDTVNRAPNIKDGLLVLADEFGDDAVLHLSESGKNILSKAHSFDRTVSGNRE